jgi:hypothetical protein
MAALRETDLIEVDDFLQDHKSLVGPPPEWRSSPRSGSRDLEATWPIADSLGIVRAQLRFRVPRPQLSNPSASVIYRNNSIWRVDLTSPTTCKLNPPWSHAQGLEARVCGSHEHPWQENRSYVKHNGFGQLPARRVIPPQVRKLSHALPWLAQRINLALSPEQREFDVPPQADLDLYGL